MRWESKTINKSVREACASVVKMKKGMACVYARINSSKEQKIRKQNMQCITFICQRMDDEP